MINIEMLHILLALEIFFIGVMLTEVCCYWYNETEKGYTFKVLLNKQPCGVECTINQYLDKQKVEDKIMQEYFEIFKEEIKITSNFENINNCIKLEFKESFNGPVIFNDICKNLKPVYLKDIKNGMD